MIKSSQTYLIYLTFTSDFIFNILMYKKYIELNA